MKRQSKLISFERPFKIREKKTKIIKIGQAVLEIFNFKDRDFDNFTRKRRQKKRKCCFLDVLHKLKNNVTSEIINALINNKQSRIFPSVDLIRRKILWMNSLIHLKYDCDIFVVTMVTILEQKRSIWKQRKLFYVEMLLFQEKYLTKLKQHGLPDALSKEFSFKCLSVMIYEQFIVSIVELIMLSWQPILLYNFQRRFPFDSSLTRL